MPGGKEPIEAGAIDRRRVLLGLAAIAAVRPDRVLAAPAADPWLAASQTLAGARVRDPVFLGLCVDALEREAGAGAVKGLLAAVAQRDAANIGDPFADADVESAARRFVEMVYTGEIMQADGSAPAIGFQQALAWQVLGFTKPPSVCGEDFGWWNQPPDPLG